MLVKTIALFFTLTSVALACEMDCRRGVSGDFADVYKPIIDMSVNRLQDQLTSSIPKVSVPPKITTHVSNGELVDDIRASIKSTLEQFANTELSKPRLAEGFYQVIFNEENPYKGDCNNPRRLTRKMPPKGESWTLEECEKMDYRCGNPPSICHFLDDVKERCIGRMRREIGEHASFDNGVLVKNLAKDTRRSIHRTLAKHGVGQLSEDKAVSTYVTKVVASIVGTLDQWIEKDVGQLCEGPDQEEVCNSWNDDIKKKILVWP
ncbi:hypothetical protein RMATCC62417_17670 [Rhizopus microsporus]|nr:hypothetical protein RMATCC62417_17670 [Rhizopus microsporus]